MNKPPSLNNDNDPLVVEEWLQKLGRFVWLIAANDAQKVQCAKFMFTGEAGHWW